MCTFCQEGSRALCQNRSELKLPADMGGGWSEYFVAHESQLFRVPEKLTDTEAALLEPTACSVHAVRRRVPRRGEHVLVVGAGPIGLNAIQAANLFCPECCITALVKYPFQAEVARSMGAQHVVFCRARDLYEQIADLTNGKVYTGKFGNKAIVGGFDVVYDCVGSAGTLKDVVVVGSLLEIGAFDYTPLWNQEITLLGSEAHGVEVVDGEKVTTFALAARLIAEGKLNVSPLLTHRFRLAEYREAMKTLMIKSRSGAIKAAFIF
jgi:threonine dehydrogenase-like Zn-dependent dehydrogenase